MAEDILQVPLIDYFLKYCKKDLHSNQESPLTIRGGSVSYQYLPACYLELWQSICDDWTEGNVPFVKERTTLKFPNRL